jgi:hypothetical protein
MEDICSSEMSATFNELHGVIYQKIALLITTAVRASNPTYFNIFFTSEIHTVMTQIGGFTAKGTKEKDSGETYLLSLLDFNARSLKRFCPPLFIIHRFPLLLASISHLYHPRPTDFRWGELLKELPATPLRPVPPKL